MSVLKQAILGIMGPISELKAPLMTVGAISGQRGPNSKFKWPPKPERAHPRSERALLMSEKAQFEIQGPSKA